MTAGRAVLALVGVCCATTVVFARAEIRIQPVPSGGRVLVSFVARDSWTLRTREFLQKSVQVSFDYDIQLRKPGPVPFFDQTLARTSLRVFGRFNTLSGKYQVWRMRDGRIDKPSERRDTEAQVRDWLTVQDQISLDPITPLEPNVEYCVHVALTTTPRVNFSLWTLLPFGWEEDAGRECFPYIK
jgi:hypothetical protein